MNTPYFKPARWVMYEQDDQGGYGEIVGASHDAQGWHYSIKGPLVNTTYARIHEDNITHTLENNSWAEINRSVASAESAYAAPEQQ